MMIRFLFPLIYSILMGGSWSLWNKKKFYQSLAPAFMLHVILVLLSGVMLKHLSIGIYGGILIAAIFFVVSIFRDRDYYLGNGRETLRAYFFEGGHLFLSSSMYLSMCLILESVLWLGMNSAFGGCF